MPRLADRILVEPILPAPWEDTKKYGHDYWPEHVVALREGIRRVPIVVADEVCEFMYAGTDQEHFTATEDFAMQAPPFPTWWVECRHPSRVVSADYGTLHWDSSTPRQWGTLFFVLPDGLARQIIHPGYYADNADARWWIGMTTYIDDPSMAPVTGKGIVEISRGFMPVGEDGMALANAKSVAINVRPDREDVANDLVGRVGSLAMPHLMAVSMMHAKNVPTRQVRPAVEMPKVAKKYAKRHGEALLSYRVIDLAPFKRTMDRGEGGSRAVGAARKALHQTRGHFKTYDEDAPLFGKHVGTYFWHSHLRGSTDAGVSDHDYEVHK